MYLPTYSYLFWHILSEELALRHRERTRLSRLAIEILGVLEGRVVDRASRFAPTFLIAVYNNISDNGVSEIALRASRGAKREVRTPRMTLSE